ncbi:DUF4391 domain-containing protein [Candidatus Kaiserbacteria bacterium CG_4_9_14_0_2_um_filter_41_32]|uniref:DUF4391 domain-containing protein n=1 Tax=Candidatus Kaiserbacteria bacterium CG_4_9_14_0_2_um_filter_41_32 TaxID=1974601 RepID=A0A2M8FE13_9BACT|nr:MAG: DUF4391 domain-containing protein [Candidatus Kaiserbacteria bacterium CG_4_9_14_0_2_um_filter_41_32]
MNFTLPTQAYVHRFIPKNKFSEKIAISTKLKKEFTDQIQKITWEYKLAEDTIGIKGTDKVEEIQIFEIQLKEKLIPKNVLKVIDRVIPYPILYIFRYEKHIAYGITLKEDSNQRYYFSEWDEDKQFNFSGTNLERVYQGIITTFIDITSEGKNFDTIVATDKQIEALKKEISILKNKVKNEKQFNKKVELNKTLLEKKKSLESIL